jgi:folylpolyglutamate synthase/dihydropteroate synthase
VVLGDVTEEAEDVIERRAARLGAPFCRLRDVSTVDEVHVGASGTSFRYRCEAWPDGERLKIPLVGRHQAGNAALALALLERAGRLPERRSVAGLLAQVSWPGRFEVWEADGCDWVLDVAHNPAGAETLARTLGDLRPVRPLVVVAAMLRRKEWRPCLAILAGTADAWVLTIAPSHHPELAWDAVEAGAFVESLEPAAPDGQRPAVEVKEDLVEALRRARELAGRGTVVVAGSCHLVGDARAALSAAGAFPVREGSQDDKPRDSTKRQGARDAI